MKKFIGFFVGGLILILMIVGSISIIQGKNNPSGNSDFDRDYIMSLVEKTDFTSYDPGTIIPADQNSGNLPEKVKGDKNAPIVIYEYADYACSHCAEANTITNKIIKDYDGKVALVFRGYILNGFKNNIEAAAAANAAAIQGYWDAYKNALFEDQVTWYYLKSSEIVEYLGNLFYEVTEGKGDLDKFYADMTSEAVAQRIAFDYGLGQKIELSGTPHFRINGEAVLASELRDKIDEILANL